MLERKKENIKEDIKQGIRQDGRDMEKYREIKIVPNYINESAEGSAYVEIGDTKVLVGVKFDTGEPYPDSPDEGTLITNAELVPLASKEYESGPPGEETVEIARVIDRGVRESGMIDLTELCIEKGEKIWMAYIDIHVLDYDGNLMDASSLASVAALMTAQMPEYDEEKDEVNRDNMEDLEVKEVPVKATGSIIGDELVFDTTAEEEEVVKSRLSVTFKEDGNLCSMQKGQNGPLAPEKIEEIVNKAEEKTKKLREKLMKAVEDQ